QAEDGIRDRNVTGVQTVLFRSKAAPRAVENQLDRCSRIVWVIRRELNLLFRRLRCEQKYRVVDAKLRKPHHVNKRRHILLQRLRSEERRVGKDQQPSLEELRDR